jgi:hypothetical protein
MKKVERNIHFFGYLVLTFITVFLFYGCKGSNGPQLVNHKSDGAPPGKVTNVSVNNIPGGATISYDLPKDKNLSYVEAVYTTKQGQKNTKASRFNNTITIKGFADTTAHGIKLYTFTAGGNTSNNPATATIHPLTPPFKTVAKSIQIQNTFGGVNVSYSGNNTRAKLAIVFINDTLGNYISVQTNFISDGSGKYSIHGLKPKLYKLGYYVRDSYQNRSDTVFSNFRPLLEVKLDKDLFSNAKLPTDSWENPRNGSVFSSIYDNACEEDRGDHNWWSESVSSMPMWITINLGQEAKISRIIYYGEPRYALYVGGYMKKFELWGSKDPNLADSTNWMQSKSWHKLGTFVNSEPRGSAESAKVNTPYPANGVTFEVPDASKKPYIKYLRIVSDKSYSGDHIMNICELDVFGSPKK